MFLKRVEMENFKSFRDVVVPFEPGFTGITGPNGSGKSNISDAVLFVLGTKSSKAIRAGRLADLIHNGGQKGKSARECKVSLVFDNTDRTIPLEADEVSLTRVVRKSRTHRDQSYSHYYVNRNPSTLTEFEDLLSHARISADGYNIVQQGDVTSIVTMSAVERRRIVDEIAGVTRFDAEIGQAEKQRIEAELNLDKTRLILSEVGKQLKQLATERERAAEYRTLREDLEATRAKLARKRVLALEQELWNVHESIASYEKEGAELLAKRQAVEKKASDLASELAALDRKMAEMGGQEARKRQERLQELREQVATARQMRNHFSDELKGLASDLSEADGQHTRCEKALKETVTERNEVEKAIGGWQKEAERVEAELEAVRETIAAGSTRSHDLQRELAQLKQEHDKVLTRRADAALERQRLFDRTERLQVELSEVEERLETAAFEAKDGAWAAKEAVKAFEALGRTKESHARQLFQEKKRLAELTAEQRKLEPELRRLQHAYSVAKAEAQAHEQVHNFSRGVEAILEARDKGELKGVCGTVAELGRPRKGLDTALEVAAGGALQAVIVEDDIVAARAIELLKKNKLGRVTFLPLSKLKASPPQGKALMAARDPEAIGFAVQLVEYDPKYAPAFSYVYRETLIVETLTAARRLMGGVRLVTREGELIEAGGAMTGGHLGANRTTFGVKRKEELEKLGAELRVLLEEAEALTAELTEGHEGLRVLHERLREVEAELVRHETKRVESERVANEAAERQDKLKGQRESVAKELGETRKALAGAEKELSGVTERLGDMEKTRDGKGKELLQSTHKSLADRLEDLRTESDRVKDALRDLDARSQALTEKDKLARERLDEAAARLAEIGAKRDEFETEITGYKESERKLKEEIEVLEEVVGSHDAEVKELRGERDGLVEAKYKVENEAARVQDAIDANGDLVVKFRGRIPVIDGSLREAQTELESLPVKAPAKVQESQDDLKSALRTIEQRMGRLEPVNMRALEEYEEHEKRKNELESELERLEEEREGLIELSDALIGRKKDALMKVFHEINANFQGTFSELSGGGAASLAFENEVDPFQGGLILKAQPPGKKIGRLDALSGGEKSLSALSFIFAVQQYAPSPFYVLDEVDMFLDGLNSELIANMIHKQSRRAQFIVVSLRKVTLKLADHVYGVTMREGVSQVVGAVNVDEITHTEELEAESASGGPPQEV